jgi:hypothetical protein
VAPKKTAARQPLSVMPEYIPQTTLWGRVKGWFARRRRAEALRRLGGPDLDEERKRNAMNGEQKGWVLVTGILGSLIAWGIWNLADFNIRARAIEAETRPSAEETLACMNACTRSCLAEEP